MGPPQALSRRGLAAALHLYLLGIAYAAVAALSLNSFMDRVGFTQQTRNTPKFGLHAMLDGTAYQPFAYRVLVPAIVDGIGKERLGDLLRRVREARLFDLADARDPIEDLRARYRDAHAVEDHGTDLAAVYWFVLLLCFGALLAFMFLLRSITRQLYPPHPQLADLGPLAFVGLLPVVFQHGGFFYDFLELFFYAAALWAVLSKRHLLLFAVLVLAVLNKETAVLLALILWPLAAANRDRTRAVLIAAAATATVLHLAVRWHVADNPAPSSFQLGPNAAFWLSKWPYMMFTTVFAAGIPFPKVQNVLFAAPLALFLILGWRRIPGLVRTTLLLAIAVNLPLYLAFCYIDEVRALSLTFVPLYLAVVGASLDPQPGAATS